MSVIPVAHFLMDFGIKSLPAEVADDTPVQAQVPGEAYWSERIEEAHARGVEEGRKAAEADALVRLEEQNTAMQQNIEAAREAWVQEAGPRLAALLNGAIAEMENRIAEAVSHVLRPFLAQAVREEAIGRLRATLQDLVGNNPGLSLEISGPEDLIDAIRASLSPAVGAVSFVVGDATDVQVKAGSSLIETRIAAWMKNFEGQVT